MRTAATDQFKAHLSRLIKSQKSAHSLQQSFYIDPQIYEQELERIFFSEWIYICHESQIPNCGDSFTYDVDRESIIVCRDENNSIHAFANVCRHRGSRICEIGNANQKRFVCPYHAWTYSLSGDLLKARQMPDEFDKSESGLVKLSIERFLGFVFVSLCENPTAFDDLKKNLTAPLEVFDIANTKVAHFESHPIQANWKLVIENFDECYHCGPAHKEFSASHSLMLDDEKQAKFDELIAQRAPLAGISTDPVSLPQTDEHAITHAPYHYDRYALFDGYLTGSQDGQPVAPLLGDVKQYDGGASNVQLGNLTYLLIYADHVVLYRFTPRGVNLTDADLVWLVRSDASDTDYDLKRMTWLWNVTTVADKEIIERNQNGVLSRYYRPGPYAPMEIYTINFIKWYLRIMA